MRHEWIEADRAQDLYARREFFDIVDAATIRDGLPFPRWVISPSLGFVVQFFDEELSVKHEIDYDPVGDCLFRSEVVDYSYPNDRQRWARSEAIYRSEIWIKPDGSGKVDTWRSDSAMNTVAEFMGLDTTPLWLPTPEFGRWAALTDPGPDAAELAERVGVS